MLKMLVYNVELEHQHVLHQEQLNVNQDFIWIQHVKHVLLELMNVLQLLLQNAYLDTLYQVQLALFVQEMQLYVLHILL